MNILYISSKRAVRTTSSTSCPKASAKSASLAPRPVTLRLSDFKSSEYRNLKGGDKYEPEESSALLGWRGASRYYDPKYVEAFKLELQAVRKVREEYGFKNLNVMIPFCRRVDEMQKVVDLMAQEGLHRGPDFKVWLMAEIPSNIILLTSSTSSSMATPSVPMT